MKLELTDPLTKEEQKLLADINVGFKDPPTFHLLGSLYQVTTYKRKPVGPHPHNTYFIEAVRLVKFQGFAP